MSYYNFIDYDDEITHVWCVTVCKLDKSLKVYVRLKYLSDVLNYLNQCAHHFSSLWEGIQYKEWFIFYDYLLAYLLHIGLDITVPQWEKIVNTMYLYKDIWKMYITIYIHTAFKNFCRALLLSENCDSSTFILYSSSLSFKIMRNLRFIFYS
jgi:hypothetical protein